MFDLQKFAAENINSDGVKEYGDVLDNADLPPVDEKPIPADLDGIPADIAREVMSRAAKDNPPQESAPDDNLTIPYSRFKELSDQKSETEKLLAAYRQRFGDINSPPPINQPPPPNPTQFQPPNLDDAFTKQIDDAITQNAMKISGLSKEDVDALDYLEDNDPRISRWRHAKKLSEATVYNDIVNRQIAQQQAAQRFDILRNQSIANYNNYVAQQQAAENFGAVQQFAENDFFNSQPELDRQIIAESYTRIANNTASPADVMVVRDFFSRAKSAFNGKKNPPAPKPAPKNFPRTNQLNGVTGSGGGVSQASLAEMLHSRPWQQIPPEYQRLLLGLT